MSGADGVDGLYPAGTAGSDAGEPAVEGDEAAGESDERAVDGDEQVVEEEVTIGDGEPTPDDRRAPASDAEAAGDADVSGDAGVAGDAEDDGDADAVPHAGSAAAESADSGEDEELRAERRRAFLSGEVPVAVYGLGKLGLPVAAVLADVCGNVTGADVDPEVVAAIEDGESPVEGEPGLDDLVAETVADGALRAVEDPAAAAEDAAIHVIVVPTLLDEDGEPDLATLIAVTSSIAAGLEPGDLVLLESTVPPGTTEGVLEASLAEASGLDREEFGVAFCPERTRSGRMLRDIREAYPKIVGGTDAAATRAAALVYDEVTDNEVIEMSDATTAEAVKVFGGIYRDVNIALANELARYADEIGVDVNETIAASNTQPLSDIHDPGVGVGGHCIPVYPHFLTEVFDVDGPVIPSARAVNEEMPEYAVERLADELAAADVDVRDATVLVLGITYRPGVAETRYSPAYGVAEVLRDFGAEVLAADPLIEEAPELAADVVPVDDVEDLGTGAGDRDAADAVLLVTPHEAFHDLDWSAFDDAVVLDGRDALDCADEVGRYCRIGDGEWPDEHARWLRADPRLRGGEHDA